MGFISNDASDLDEVTIADSQRYIYIIQSLVTQEDMVINGKKIPQFTTRSCHRYIMTADTEMPIPVRRDERRFFVIRSSDELKVKAGAFFNKLCREYFCDRDIMKTCFQFFMNRANADSFMLKPIPKSEYFIAALAKEQPPVEMWLKFYVASPQENVKI